MCQQEHEPIRQVQQKNGNPAFKCNCGKFHPFKRFEPNEMDVSVCVNKSDISELSEVNEEGKLPNGENLRK